VSNLRVLKRGHSAAVVAELRTLLERARAGEILSLSWVAEMDDGNMETGHTAVDDIFRHIGAASVLVHRLTKSADQEPHA
jgi:hypothetical protein